MSEFYDSIKKIQNRGISLVFVPLRDDEAPFVKTKEKSFKNYRGFFEWCLRLKKNNNSSIKLFIYYEGTTFETYTCYPEDSCFSISYYIEQQNNKIKL